MFDSYYVDMFARVFAICLVLTGIHGYLGIHVLSRQVIFVDLAMGQIAALGATYALLLGYDPTRHPADALPAYLFSLGFTLLGAAVFALTRARRERVPQEAIIGVVYASASAAVLLMLAKSPTAGEQIKHMLVGNILLVTWPLIAKTAAIYAAIGVFHWVFRRPFLAITLDPARAEQEGVRIRLWDFLFYLTFGVVITSSVAIAGVLLVFSFLVVPAAVGLLFAESTAARVWIGWAAGVVVSLLGIACSFAADLPAGPAVVVAFATVLAVASLASFVGHAPSRALAVGKIAAGAAVLAAAFYGTTFLAKATPAHARLSATARLRQALATGDETTVIAALDHLGASPDPTLLAPILSVVEKTRSERVLEHAVRALALFHDPAVAPVLANRAGRETDPYLRVEIARAMLLSGSARGIPILLDVLAAEDAVLPRKQAVALLRHLTGKSFGYRAEVPRAANTSALARWREYWRQKGARLRWNEHLGRFE